MMADNGNVISGGSARGCPLDPVLSLLAHKWLAHIIWFLGHAESLRFAELQRRLPGNISAKVLSARLKELEALNMVARDDKGTTPHMSNTGSHPTGVRSTTCSKISN
jgi:DNA-binding HxlR family transcriptional regulator